MHIIETPNDRDPQLWEIAKKRAGFKGHLFSYIIINTMLWVMYFFTKEGHNDYWPAWTSLFWGVGLAFHYVGAYIRPFSSAEAEYEKLKNKQ